MDGKQVCCIVAFLFVFIILVGAICWTNMDCFEGFTDVMKANNETIKNKILGGKHYQVVKPNEKVVEKMKELHQSGKIGLFALVADWCGYCKRLKDSGVLTEISKNYPVFVINEQHSEMKDLLHMLKAQGFPTLAIFYNGNLKNYEGSRDARSIQNEMEQIKKK